MRKLEPSVLYDPSLLVRYRFLVMFLTRNHKGYKFPYPADIRFQKVSGLKALMEVDNISQGGDNSSVYHLPNKISYENLILEGGRTRFNANFSVEISKLFSSLTCIPVDVLITSINFEGLALSAWMVKDAYPVKWSVSDLDANSNEVIIDTLELAYKNLNSVVI